MQTAIEDAHKAVAEAANDLELRAILQPDGSYRVPAEAVGKLQRVLRPWRAKRRAAPRPPTAPEAA